MGGDRRQKKQARAAARKLDGRSREARELARKAPPPFDEEASRRSLRGLAAFFQEDGPLHPFLFGEELAQLLPPERTEANESDALVRMWTDAAPRVTDLRYRRAWRDFLVRMQDELIAGAPDYHPDRMALDHARFWIGDRRSTGPAALENVFLQLLFDLSCEQGFFAGWLPAWLAQAYGFSIDVLEAEQHRRRERRALQRITFGPLTVQLPRHITPSIGEAIQKLAQKDLDPDALAEAAMEAADRDLTPERLSQAALFFREASENADSQHSPFAAFDLRAIFEVLAEGGQPGDRAVRLLYARAIDATLATSQHRRKW